MRLADKGVAQEADSIAWRTHGAGARADTYKGLSLFNMLNRVIACAGHLGSRDSRATAGHIQYQVSGTPSTSGMAQIFKERDVR